MRTFFLAISVWCTGIARLAAHDTWVETNTNLIRTGDAVYIDLKLGNHGNDHRDFKLASKVDLDPCTLEVIGPDEKSYDLKDALVDVGYAPKEGYWQAKFSVAKAGLYLVSHRMDSIVKHGRPVRSIRSAKTFFLASPSLDRVAIKNAGFDRRLGHPLEIVPVTNPITPMGPGEPIDVRVYWQGKPLPGARVSFIPRGETLKKDFDPKYERRTDAAGRAAFTPATGNSYLVVTHRKGEPGGAGYDRTDYSATLVVFVPEKCPCCGE